MRLVPVMLTGLVLVALAPAVAGPRPPGPATVLVIADVGENARRSMPAALWRKLATDYVGRSAAAEDGTALPDDARCRTAHLQYAVFATFDRAMRLPGLAQDTDRAYGIARFTVRNCATGAVTSKTVRVESEPLSAVDLRDDELTAPQTWERAVRATLAREPLLLPRDAAAPVTAIASAAPASLATPAPDASPIPVAPVLVARVLRVDGDLVILTTSGPLTLNELLHDVADGAGKLHAPFDLVVVELAGKYVVAHIIGDHVARVGDRIEAAP